MYLLFRSKFRGVVVVVVVAVVSMAALSVVVVWVCVCIYGRRVESTTLRS